MKRREFLKRGFLLIAGLVMSALPARTAEGRKRRLKEADFYKRHDLAG